MSPAPPSDLSPSGTRGRSLILRSTLVLLGVILLVEATLRILEPLVPALGPVLSHAADRPSFEEARSTEELLEASGALRPGSIVVDFISNSKGFQTAEYTERKPSDTYRVLVLGDSYAFSSGGVPHSKRWPALLQAGLQRFTEDRIEVINLGVPGVGPDFELRLWELEGTQLEVDLVVLGFAVGSDFRDAMQDRMQERKSAGWALHSYCARALNYVAAPRETRAKHPPRTTRWAVPENTFGVPVASLHPDFHPRYDPLRPRKTEPDFLRLESSRARVSEKARARWFGRAFLRTTELLLALRDGAREAGVPLVVLVIPDAYQVSQSVRGGMLEFAGRPASDYDVDRPQRQLTEFFVRQSIPYVDVLDGFRTANQNGPLYHPHGTHWNDRGNTLAAVFLSSFIAEQFWGLLNVESAGARRSD